MKRLVSLSLLLCLASTAWADGLWPPGETPKEPVAAPAEAPAEPTPIASAPAPIAASTVKLAPLSDKDFEKTITINKTVLPLQSKLKKMYTAYKITVVSDYPDTLSIKNANINNAVTGSAAAETMRKSPWRGLGWALIPYVGIIAGPAVAIKNSVKNAKAVNESAAYAGQVPGVDLKRGEPLSFSALVPAGQSPVMTFKFWDKERDATYIYNSF